MSEGGHIIAIDCETTGLHVDSGQILSLSLVALDETTGREVDRLRVKIGYRGDVIPEPGAIAATGINPFTHRGLTERDAADKIGDFLARNGGKNATILGQNVSFDARWVRNLLSRNGRDAKLVPLAQVDTITETVRALYEGRVDPDKFDQKKVGVDGRTAPSMRLSSIARALGVPVDETRTHDDEYDLKLTINVWRALGAPKLSPVHPANNPYEAEAKLAGKTITVTEWDGRNSQFVKNRYYVTGKGAGEVTDAYGSRRYNKTVLIKIDTPEFEELVERSEAGNVTATSLKGVLHERGFSSPAVLNMEVENPSDEAVSKLKAIEERVLNYVGEERRREREKDYIDRLSAASGEAYQLVNPGNKSTVIDGDDEAIVPALAAEMAGRPREERVAMVSALANGMDPPRGVVWAHAIHVMAERFGYRNGLAGYEDSRAANITRAVPSELPINSLVKSVGEVEGPVARALERVGGVAVRFESDGVATSVSVIGGDGQILSKEERGHVEAWDGRLSPPKAAEVADMVANLLGTSKTASAALRRGFEPYADDSSLEAIKRRFNAEIRRQKTQGKEGRAQVLEEIRDQLGASHGELVANTGRYAEEARVDDRLEVEPIGEALVTLGRNRENTDTAPLAGEALATANAASKEASPRPREAAAVGALQVYMADAERLRDEIVKIYQEEPTVSVEDDASNIERVLANLSSPALNRREVDLHALQLGSLALSLPDQAGVAADQTEPVEIPAEELGVNTPGGTTAGGRDENDTPAKKRRGRKSTKLTLVGDDRVTQCKVCRKWVKSANAVSGMGPTCARRLGLWLERPEVATAELASQKFKKIGELKESGVYPIMLVRDPVTGRTFAADIIRREKDGRYLVIDLSQIAVSAKSGGTSVVGGDAMREAVRIYLDPSNHEVRRVFGGG